MAVIQIAVKVFCNKCGTGPLTTDVIGESIFISPCLKCEERVKEAGRAKAFNEGWRYGRKNT